ncbi:MAG TPA: hypothetical protein VJY65_07775, partial [Chloroflexota bacterium]|nr:hypothetical protein [Chloroflexota bacterium]
IGNTHRGVLDWVASTFGGRVSDNAQRYSVRNLKTWRWRATSNDACRVLDLMLPYLRIKSEQARLAIEFQRHITTYAACKSRPLSSDEVAWRDEKRAAISERNLRSRHRG